jgi:hypothetical protein
VLIFSAGQFAGVIAWFSLPDISLTVPRSYLLLMNLFWGMISLVAGTGMLFGSSLALPLAKWGAVAFAAFQVFDNLVLRTSQYALRARAFNIAATLGLTIIFLLLLYRPSVHSFFRRKTG